PGPGILQAARRRASQPEGVIEFPIGEESGVTGDGRAVELQLDLAVELDAQEVILAVTHWVPLSFWQERGRNAGFSRVLAQIPCRKPRFIWEMWGQVSARARCRGPGAVLMVRPPATSPFNNKRRGVGPEQVAHPTFATLVNPTDSLHWGRSLAAWGFDRGSGSWLTKRRSASLCGMLSSTSVAGCPPPGRASRRTSRGRTAH